jgi:hypothetical protein
MVAQAANNLNKYKTPVPRFSRGTGVLGISAFFIEIILQRKNKKVLKSVPNDIYLISN